MIITQLLFSKKFNQQKYIFLVWMIRKTVLMRLRAVETDFAVSHEIGVP